MTASAPTHKIADCKVHVQRELPTSYFSLQCQCIAKQAGYENIENSKLEAVFLMYHRNQNLHKENCVELSEED